LARDLVHELTGAKIERSASRPRDHEKHAVADGPVAQVHFDFSRAHSGAELKHHFGIGPDRIIIGCAPADSDRRTIACRLETLSINRHEGAFVVLPAIVRPAHGVGEENPRGQSCVIAGSDAVSTASATQDEKLAKLHVLIIGRTNLRIKRFLPAHPHGEGIVAATSPENGLSTPFPPTAVST
jgi:hypothetical protein